FTDCGLLVGGVLLILGVALGLTGFLIDAEVPQHAVEWVTANVHSTVAFLLLLNLFLIVVGALMDIYSAIIVVVPLIVPLGVAFGIDPIHLGIIFLTNLELGYLVPPVGENLFIAAYRFNKPIGELVRAVLPMVGVLFVGVLAVTYVPGLSLWLVGRMR
ncbi:MAG: TRAP transporter large permease subunit, partial [Thermoanaerobaculia bacterium]